MVVLIESHDISMIRRIGNRAFTLVEVLAVVVILGIAASLVVPQMSAPSTLTIQAAARAVIGDLMVAQNEAVGMQTTRKAIFDSTANNYRLADQSDQTLTMNWRGGNYQTSFNSDSRFSGVKISSADFGGQNWVSFDEMGSPSSGGSIDLTAGGVGYRITVAPFTGRVTVAPIATGG